MVAAIALFVLVGGTILVALVVLVSASRPSAPDIADVDFEAVTAAASPVIIPVLEIDGPVIPEGADAENELDVPPDARTA